MSTDKAMAEGRPYLDDPVCVEEHDADEGQHFAHNVVVAPGQVGQDFDDGAVHIKCHLNLFDVHELPDEVERTRWKTRYTNLANPHRFSFKRLKWTPLM